MCTDAKYEEIMAEVRKLRKIEEELMDIRKDMLRYKVLVNEYWVSGETEGINDLIDKLLGTVKRNADELYGIGHDMIRFYDGLTGE